MGMEVQKAAIARDHEVVLVIDKDNRTDLNREKLSQADVAMEFSQPEAAADNIIKCLESGIPVVSGTTGWLSRYSEVTAIVEKSGGTLLYASNFSIGVNILFNINRRLAGIMNNFDSYDPAITEIHHTKKLDAPSGTAITLADNIIENTCYEGWIPGEKMVEGKIPVRSVREGDIPGIHEVCWKSETDALTLRHESFSRSGLALGAVLAAEFIRDRKGLFTMSDLLGF